jgi:hypothetical protein
MLLFFIKVSRSVFGTLNYFGGPLEVCPKASNQLLQIERSDDSAMMVFVSDLWLDKPAVIQKFNQVLLFVLLIALFVDFSKTTVRFVYRFKLDSFSRIAFQ